MAEHINVSLSFRGGDETLIGINTVSERARLMQAHGDNGPEAIWSPCEWRQDWGELTVPLSPELQALCDTANQDIAQNEREQDVVKFFVALANALYAADLPLRRAEEFVAVLVAEELGDVEEQVEQQLSARARKKLIQGGWLPK